MVRPMPLPEKAENKQQVLLGVYRKRHNRWCVPLLFRHSVALVPHSPYAVPALARESSDVHDVYKSDCPGEGQKRAR
jgi:hypothetical protein